MKRFFVALVFCFTTSQVMAQTQTLLDGPIEHGGYGGPEIKVTQVNDETGVLFGGRGGWIINNTFCIGGGGYGLSTMHEAPREAQDFYHVNGVPRDLDIGLGYGGLILEYIHQSDSLVHFTAETLIGAGGITYSEDPDNDDSWDKSDAFFVLEPGFGAEVNITEWFRIMAGVSYIYVNGIDENKMVGMEDQDFGGLSGNLLFKFGSF